MNHHLPPLMLMEKILLLFYQKIFFICGDSYQFMGDKSKHPLILDKESVRSFFQEIDLTFYNTLSMSLSIPLQML
jgi:hypothetical protein